jgi:3',5'-nucleoside bisphosphate phosphatase
VKLLAVDLHIHTALSPCAMDDVTPPAVVRAATVAGLAMIAVCDHNTAGNAAAVQEAAEAARAGGAAAPTVVAGIEITTAEDVHVVGLFPDAASAEATAREVLKTLPRGRGRSGKFGRQLLMDARGAVRGTEPRMLAAASHLGLNEAVALIKAHGGLAVAAHVDRPSFSVLSQLGVFPEDAGFDAIEISAFSRNAPRAAEMEAFGLPVLSSSDAHSLEEIGGVRSVLTVRQATFEELALAMRGTGGRGARHA